MRFQDVSLALSHATPVWPGDEPFQRVESSSVNRGDGFSLSSVAMSSHTGTHVDAPCHFVQGGATVDQIPLDRLIGPAWVCEVPRTARTVTAELLEAAGIPAGTTRLLLSTANSALWGSPGHPMLEDFVALSEDAAGWIALRAISLLGIDSLSVDPYSSTDHPAHRVLLASGITIVEGLNLRSVPPGPSHLFCLPLRIAGGEGSPARVILGWDDRRPLP